MMKQFKYTIANTLPDQRLGKFTKNVLKKFRDQINTAIPHLPVKIGTEENQKKIGYVKDAVFSNGDLSCMIEVDPSSLDKQWEYFFVPDGSGKLELQGKFEVYTSGSILGVLMVRSPTDLTSKPITFFEYIEENQDYFIKEYTELDELTVKRIKKSGEQTYVYYPVEIDPEALIKDARQRGLVIDHKEDDTGETVRPFSIDSFDGTFEEFRKHINNLWKIQIENMEKMVNPSKKPTKMQS